MKTLAEDFDNINPEMLDDWFSEMMERYKNSPMYWHLKATYMALTEGNDDFVTYVLEGFTTRVN